MFIFYIFIIDSIFNLKNLLNHCLNYLIIIILFFKILNFLNYNLFYY